MPLLPAPRVPLRAVLASVAVALIVIAAGGWTLKIVGMLFWVGLLGSYRHARIEEGEFRASLVAWFIPVSTRRIRLDRVGRLGCDVEETFGWLWGFVVGWGNLVLFWVLDWLLPWIGGRYRVWLVSPKGRRMLAWQGSSDAAFRANVDRLESATGLTLERTGFSP